MSVADAFILAALAPLVATAQRLDAGGRHAWLRELRRESPLVADAVRALLEDEASFDRPPASAPPHARG